MPPALFARSKAGWNTWAIGASHSSLLRQDLQSSQRANELIASIRLVNFEICRTIGIPVLAQTPVTGVDDPEALVKSKDKKLEANKQLILDLFREVLEAHHTELISKYLAPDFIQHNPSAAELGLQ